MSILFNFRKEIKSLSGWQLNNLLDLVKLEDDQRIIVIDEVIERLLLMTDETRHEEIRELASVLYKSISLIRYK